MQCFLASRPPLPPAPLCRPAGPRGVNGVALRLGVGGGDGREGVCCPGSAPLAAASGGREGWRAADGWVDVVVLRGWHFVFFPCLRKRVIPCV